MVSGIIDNWGFDILSTDYKKCVCGEIFESNQFSDGKMIYTSNISDVYLFNKYLAEDLNLEPNIIVETINSKYILSNVSNNFKDYINSLITTNKLDSNEYNFNTSKGISTCIKWYLNKIV